MKKIIKLLESLISIQSVTSDCKTCEDIIVFCQNFLLSKSINHRIIKINGKPVLIWGELDLKKTRWLINSHLDVVPGVPSQFVTKKGKDRIWGRGAADTKSSCSIILNLSKSINSISTKKHLSFMLVVDEEVGGDSTKEILASMTSLKGAIFLEPTDNKIITQAKGIIQLKITSFGKSSHGSRPWDGDNALEKLAKQLTEFRRINPNPTHETKQTTFNYSVLNSGQTINQIPSAAILWCDIRWNPNDDPKKILSLLKNNFSGCRIEIVKLESAINCPIESNLFKSFSRSLNESSIQATPGFEHGSSDARHVTALNIPALVFGPKGGNLHGLDEWVDTKSLDKTRLVLSNWIKTI